MYLYVPKRDHSKMPLFDSAPLTFNNEQIFHDNRYSGYDRQSSHNQISLGVNSYFYNHQGLTKAQFGIGRIYNFTMPESLLGENLKIRNKFSPWTFDGSYYLSSHLSLNGNLVRQPLNKDQDTSLGIQYAKNSNVINITYNFIRNEQLDPKLMVAASQAAVDCDICIIVGTSMAVYPASSIPFLTKEDCLIFYVDPGEKDFYVAKSRELFFKHIQKNATVGIKEVYDKLLTNI